MKSQHNYLNLALTEAKKGKGFCAPNPAVGAVIVKDGKILATGFHAKAGEAHAEVNAINTLTDVDCEGADIYVTLEPCSHQGRTPPCADLIIQKKFKKVVYGFADPNPLVAGKGAEKIRQSGIACEQIQIPEIDDFYRSYAYWVKHQKPYLTFKIAISLDGKIALAGHKPVKLTAEEADVYTHEQRRYADAILSTVKTVIADDPKFNARTIDSEYKKNLFLIDSQQALPLNAQVFQTTEHVNIFLAEANQPKYAGAKSLNCIPMPWDHQGVDLQAVLMHLSKQGFHDVWIEAGAHLLNAMLQQKLVNRLIVYVTPKILGTQAVDGFINDVDLPVPNWKVFGENCMAEFIF